MTAVDVDALDKLREAATAGPWAQHPVDLLYVIGDISDGGESYLDVADTVAAEYPDAALIVAAVNALPELLAEVRRGRALREAVEGLAEVIADEAVDAIWHRDVLKQTAARITAVVAAVDAS